MFKLFKDLTRPPESLSARPSPQPDSPVPINPPYVPRQPRGRSPARAAVRKDAPAPVEVKKEVEETDEHAKRVVELLKSIEGDKKELMHYTLSQLNSLPVTSHTMGAVRRHEGFAILKNVLAVGFATHQGASPDSGEQQVIEVQRVEGIRLWLEVLGWSLQERENRKAFDLEGGYSSLLTPLKGLSRSTDIESDILPSTSTSSPVIAAPPSSVSTPDGRILAHLLAHICDDNYTILSLFADTTALAELSEEAFKEKLGGLVIRRPSALPLLWQYVWGLRGSDNPSHPSAKGKEKESQSTYAHGLLDSGHLESHNRLIQPTLRILLHAAHASISNLFAIRRRLPYLADFLCTRLFGKYKSRKFEVTFPARPEWFSNVSEETEDDQEVQWKEPTPALRELYLALLRRLLEAGVDQHLVWRLFSVAKIIAPPPLYNKSTAGNTAESSPATGSRSQTASPLPMDEPLSAKQIEATTPKAKKKRPKPGLHISTAVALQTEERLRGEILDLIKHAMRAKWPDAFVLRGGGHDVDEGGLELIDMGRAWPSGQKGFNFSCWLYITKLNRPITVFAATQSNQSKALFYVKILENSQIALFASDLSVPPKEGETSTEDHDIVCSAPDALVPHHQWVHFAVGLRKPKGSATGEARIFVNGVRVGAMRITYPQPHVSAVPRDTHAAHPAVARPTVASADTVRLSIARGPTDAPPKSTDGVAANGGKQEENEWLLGRSILLEEVITEDLVLLMHHLGPRYHGNFQEALGKFLTYEGATSINIYLSNLAQNAADKKLFTKTSNSDLIKAIRQGPAIAEENLILSTSARDIIPSNQTEPNTCFNGAVPHPFRAGQLRHGTMRLQGNVETQSLYAMDESVSSVGGGTVILKMIDLSESSEELAITLGILRDMIKDSWSASEEMERIRGFEMLAAILRPKMPNLVDITCTKIILSMLGIHMDKPQTATVHNSAAYRAIALEFELWSSASLGVVTLYLQHFEYLLATSKHARFNVLRTFQKAAMVKKMLYALRSGLFDLAVVPVVVETLKLALLARWSAEDAIKPIFSYLVSALCQSNASFAALYSSDPPPSQAPAAQILSMIAGLTAQPARLLKLNKSLALHRLLVIFISSNSAYYVVLPCLDILEKCLATPGLESFQRAFEAEGGFALLARTLGPIWRDDVQEYVFRMLLGDTKEEEKKDKDGLKCAPLVSAILSALEFLLQSAGDEEGGRPSLTGRTRSGTITSVRSVAMTPLVTDVNGSGNPDTRLTDLVNEIIKTYRAYATFRRTFTGRKIEQMLPAIVEYAAVTSSTNRPETIGVQRAAVAEWLATLIARSKASQSLVKQMKLVEEQLRTIPSSPKLSSSVLMSPTSPRPSTSHFGGSFSGRLSSTPPASPMLGSSMGGIGGPIPRRRPSTEAGSMMGSFGGIGRSRSIKEKRIPLKRVLTGESVLEGGKDKNAAWKLIIMSTDSQSHSKMTLERKDHWQRLSEVEWPKLAAGLRAENGLWPDDLGPATWRLDGSEGPLRMRNRLERINAAPELGPQRTRHKLRDAIPSVDELSSAVSRMNVAPWEDPFSLALGEAGPIAEEESPLAAPAPPANQPPSPSTEDRLDDDSYIEVEDNKDDKMRRIAKTLQAGDVVEQAHNIVRIVGVDACPGLLIFGKKNLYLVDGLVQTAEGEVIDAKDAPRDVLSVPGTLADLDGSEQESHRWSYNEIVENNKRAFLFRDVALEMYFSDKRNFLIVFKDKRERQNVVQKLTYKSDQSGSISKSIIGNFVLDTVAKAIDRSEQQLEAVTRKWQSREISNFTYLQLLNQHANRTPNDVTQYPIFPWVLADYTSPILDLEKQSSFRDLNLPMGALTPARREAAIERYSATEGVGEQPFHYGTHYSSSMIVCGFLIRMSPFTEIFLALQGGNFDLADRLFSSIPRAWDSASADNRGDVRELIPEFYYSSSFMLNINHHDFGRKQVTGDSVDNVVLPPWALNDPLLFIHRHREALESDHVSRHLSAWIDLTFGYKQRDQTAFNCFHPLSYRGAVDLETIEDESEKAASTAIIHNFGQTPAQIFKAPHPHRFLSGKSTLPITTRFGVAEQWQLLFRSILPITESTTPIWDLVESIAPDIKPTTQMRFRLIVPGTLLSVQYGFKDGSLRIYYQEFTTSLPRLVHLVEGLSVIYAIFAAPTLLVTASEHGVLTAWRLTIRHGGYRRGDVGLSREATLRGHDSKITTLAASPAWSFLVSGTEDGRAMIWDMNRLRYLRTLEVPHREAIMFSAINEADGHIALASKYHLYVFSINGHPIASTSIENDNFAAFSFGFPPAEEKPRDEFTGGISFLKREFMKYGALFVIGVGKELALYRCVPGFREPAYEAAPDEDVGSAEEDEDDFEPWRLVEQGRLRGSETHKGGDCIMVKFMGETLYAAFKPGVGAAAKYVLYQWSLPEGNARHVPDNVSHVCMARGCGRHFGLLEPKRYCGGCGGVFCGTHCVQVEAFDRRYCEACRAQLSEAMALGILTNRRDSAYPSTHSRRGSLAPASAPGSRRPSINYGTRSRAGSRAASRSVSRRPSFSAQAAPGTSGVVLPPAVSAATGTGTASAAPAITKTPASGSTSPTGAAPGHVQFAPVAAPTGLGIGGVTTSSNGVVDGEANGAKSG